MVNPVDETVRERRDAETASLLARGDPEGLRRLLADHAGAVLAVLESEFLGQLDRQMLEDALADALIRTWRAGASYDERWISPAAWLYVVARNRASSLAEEQRRLELVYRGDLDEEPSLDASPVTAAIAAEAEVASTRFAATLAQCMECLSNQQRAVLQADLAHGGAVSASALAEALQTTRTAIYVARHFGRRALRDALQRLGYTLHARDRAPMRLRGEA